MPIAVFINKTSNKFRLYSALIWPISIFAVLDISIISYRALSTIIYIPYTGNSRLSSKTSKNTGSGIARQKPCKESIGE
jgi:hypothetical protein